MADTRIVWFRQDLRLADQAALSAAAAVGPMIGLYVLDDDAPGEWAIGGAQRWWLHHSLASLAKALGKHGVPLVLRRGKSVDEVRRLAEEVGAAEIHALHHYEPWWQDAEAALLKTLPLVLHHGTRLAPPDTILSGGGGRYRMFSAFWGKLQQHMPPPPLLPVPRLSGPAHAPKSDTLADWDLLPTKPAWAGGFDVWQPGEAGAVDELERFADIVGAYGVARNLPSQNGTSRLSPHLHHGEISPAAVWHALARRKDAEPFLRELAWRDFTGNIIDFLPDYATKNGRDTLDDLPWRTGAAADRDFTAWTKGLTGYPIVDAGMRQLWTMGWMHNRVRMITASFSIKHLLLDWRRGERWFWDTLVDADYGNNSVNWQWIAGTGVDYNQWGRIMAPLVQSPKFDAAGYIREWVPELAGLSDEVIHDPHGAGVALKGYPKPLIGHREGRERAIAAGRAVRAT